MKMGIFQPLVDNPNILAQDWKTKAEYISLHSASRTL